MCRPKPTTIDEQLSRLCVSWRTRICVASGYGGGSLCTYVGALEQQQQCLVAHQCLGFESFQRLGKLLLPCRPSTVARFYAYQACPVSVVGELSVSVAPRQA